MKLTHLALLVGLLLTSSCTPKETIDYVDPFIGTGAHGHTYPGATTPFGAVQLSPDTRTGDWDACSGYHYSDQTIIGFSHTHLSGTGCADLGDILFHPTSSKIDTTRQDRIYEPYIFSHKDEKATAGYYSVDLRNENLKVELTAAPHTGVHRYTFAKGASQQLAIDLTHLLTDEAIDTAFIAQTSPREVTGMRRTTGWVGNQHIYFAVQFSKDIDKINFLRNGSVALLSFGENDPLIAKVGLSLVSVDNARANMLAEVADFDFDAAHARARKMWRESLEQIKIEGGSERDKTLFYTALYHTKLAPNITSDTNGDFRRSDQTISNAGKTHKTYSTFSLWDTFRAWSPLQILIDPSLINDMIRSMLDMYDCIGELPLWPLSSGETNCMIGYHSVSVIADAYLKGIRGFDAQKALEAMKHSSDINKKGSDFYLSLGYIPANIKRESVSCLLEYAYDDWCIAQMAHALGDTIGYNNYTQRALNYVHIFDGSSRFFRGKNLDGSWSTPLNEFSAGRDYTEATPWQYRFFVPHDINGLIQLFGGKKLFSQELERLFSLETPTSSQPELVDITGVVGQYAHGNEPSHHMAYLFNYVGEPWKTQKWTRYLLENLYQATPEGISGNEDCGQMSAWYILSSIGLYAVCPASDQFSLTTPLFEKATLQLGNGKTLVITANNPTANQYIDRVTFNGKCIDKNYITYAHLSEGGQLIFTLTAQPNLLRGTTEQALPYSQTVGQHVSIPYTTQNPSLFTDTLLLDLASATPDATIRYTLDGQEPTEESALYTAPLSITATTTLKAKAFKQGYSPSKTQTILATKAEFATPVVLKQPLVNGVHYSYYKGHFSEVEQIAAGHKIASGVMPTPSILDAPDSDHFAYIFEGWIRIPEDGVWTFSTKSDDGSVLYIADQAVVNNNGSHAAITATGRIALKRGFHRFKLLYFEDYEGEALECALCSPKNDTLIPLSPDFLYL
ncbi:MAG: GH92 family glycosyl hydrolase [Alistipes sp.]